MKDETSLTEILQRVAILEHKIDLLISAAKEGGGLVPAVDYSKMVEWRKKSELKLKCKKECAGGPCRYGPNQALICFEKLEKEAKKRKRRKMYKKYIPYTKAALKKLRRSELMIIGSILKVNIRDILLKKNAGNSLLVDKILEAQPGYVQKREKIQQQKIKDVNGEGSG